MATYTVRLHRVLRAVRHRAIDARRRFSRAFSQRAAIGKEMPNVTDFILDFPVPS